MNGELQQLIDQFLKILHLYSVIGRKPKDYGTGDLLYFTELHTITMVARNDEVNMTQLAEIMGVTKGAISQTIRKLVHKNLIMRTNMNNRKEINLRLSEKGRRVLSAQESFQKEIFTFAAALYENASPEDRDTVRRLFLAIAGNMEERVKALKF
jgi:DNA-binding MarR family transcriptional regulator